MGEFPRSRCMHNADFSGLSGGGVHGNCSFGIYTPREQIEWTPEGEGHKSESFNWL